jgi:hypothetical protein
VEAFTTPQLVMWMGVNFGFAAVVAGVLLAQNARREKEGASRDQRREEQWTSLTAQWLTQLADIIKSNTMAMTELKSVIAAMCDRMDRLEKK